MALLEVKIELNRVVRALERIADVLERAYPPPQKIDSKPAGVDNLTVFEPEEEWQREQEDERQREQGLLPGSRRHP